VFVAGCRTRTFQGSQVQDSWNASPDNSPNVFSQYGELEYSFDVLKARTEGELEPQPWSDTYWPHGKGGITYRWRTDDFRYESPHAPEAIEAMSGHEINKLSPAEKYDIVTGGYRKGWPMWRREASLTTSCPLGIAQNTSQMPKREIPAGASWEGKCHAWTPAALHFPEPGAVDVPVAMASGKTLLVHFGSSDIKALLTVSFDMFLNQYPEYARTGNRCNETVMNLGQQSSSPCLDTNAGAFFVLVTNLVQKGKKGFALDKDPGFQVWNHPVWKYSHTIREGECPIAIEKPASPSGKVAFVTTTLFWIGEKTPSEEPHGKNNSFNLGKYEYCVEMDAKNKVVGGAWAGHNRPDFLWMVGKPDFNRTVRDSQTGMMFDFRLLMSIYEKSRGSLVPPPSL
jgi:hypothetical protein